MKGKCPIFLWVPYSGMGAMVVINSYTLTASNKHSEGILDIDWKFNDPNVANSIDSHEMKKVQNYIISYVMDYLK